VEKDLGPILSIRRGGKKRGGGRVNVDILESHTLLKYNPNIMTVRRNAGAVFGGVGEKEGF